MTIASEITRLQWAKTDIKSSIEWKWVSVPSDAKLDTYNTYIDQIKAWIWWLEVFIPETLTILNAIRNTNASPWMRESIYDWFSSEEDVYYHYFWYRDDDDTAEDWYKIWAISKTAWNDLQFHTWFASYRNGNYNSYTRVVSKRMKKSWNDVMVSVLWTNEYDRSWSDPSGRNMTYYCTNITNTTGATETLWTIYADSWWQYSQADIDSMYAAWTTSCGMTSSDVLTPLWLTSISFPQASTGSWYYNLVATINYQS